MRGTGYIGRVSGIKSPYTARAFLWDFDVGGHALKASHKSWLEKNIIAPVRALPESDSKVWIDGTASRPGSVVHNKRVSAWRAKAVLDFLASALRGSKVTYYIDWEGETPAKHHHHSEHREFARDRAVQICFLLSRSPPSARSLPEPPPPIQRPELRDAGDKLFQIRLLGAYAGGGNPLKPASKMPTSLKEFRSVKTWKPGLSFEAENVYFEILDPATMRHAIYVYSGLGATYGPPLPGIDSLSVTHVGDWNNFLVPSPHSVDEFEGSARLFQAAINAGSSKSWNTFCFGGFRSWDHYLVEIQSFQTGVGIGMPSVSETIGTMKLKIPATRFAPITVSPALHR